RLQNQHSKHHNRIERLPAGATLPHLLRCQHHRLDIGAKALPWHQSIDCFERIAFRRQCRQPLVRIKEPQLPHPGLRESSPSRARFAQVSGRSYFSRRPEVFLLDFSFLFFSEIGSGAAPQGPPPEGVRESLTLCTCPASAGLSFLASWVSCVCGLADTSRGCDGAGPYPH